MILKSFDLNLLKLINLYYCLTRTLIKSVHTDVVFSPYFGIQFCSETSFIFSLEQNSHEKIIDQNHFILFCIVISDLYLFQDIVLLNPCIKFLRNFMLSFMDKLSTGAYYLLLLGEARHCLFKMLLQLLTVLAQKSRWIVIWISSILDIVFSFDHEKSSSCFTVTQRQIKRSPKITQNI